MIFALLHMIPAITNKLIEKHGYKLKGAGFGIMSSNSKCDSMLPLN